MLDSEGTPLFDKATGKAPPGAMCLFGLDGVLKQLAEFFDPTPVSNTKAVVQWLVDDYINPYATTASSNYKNNMMSPVDNVDDEEIWSQFARRTGVDPTL